MNPWIKNPCIESTLKASPSINSFWENLHFISTILTVYLIPVVNFCEVWSAQLVKSTLLTSTLVHLGSFKFVQMLKREWVRKGTGSYRTYSIPGKTAGLIPEFAVEDLSSAELQPRLLRLMWRTCPWAEYSDEDFNSSEIGLFG